MSAIAVVSNLETIVEITDTDSDITITDPDFLALVDSVIAIGIECKKMKWIEDEYVRQKETFKTYFKMHLDQVIELRGRLPRTKGRICIKGKLMTWSEFCDEYFGVSTQWVAIQIRAIQHPEEIAQRNAKKNEKLLKTIVRHYDLITGPEPAPGAVTKYDINVGEEPALQPVQTALPDSKPPVKLTREIIERDNLLPPGFASYDKGSRWNHFQHELVWHLHDGKPATGNRGNGMAVDRLRDLAKKLGVPVGVSFATDYSGFVLRIPNLSERGAREILKFIGEDNNEQDR